MFARAIVVDVEADAESKRLRGELEPPAPPPDEDGATDSKASGDEGPQSEDAKQTGPSAKYDAAADALYYEVDHNYDHFAYEYVGDYYLDRPHEEL